MMQMDIFSSVPGYKKCALCGKYRETFRFNKSKTTKDGLQSYCKDCQRIYHHRHPNKEFKKNKRDNFSLNIFNDDTERT